MSAAPTVRRALPEDAEAFAACHLACWREAYEDLWGASGSTISTCSGWPSGAARRSRAGIADHFLVEDGRQVVGIAIAGPARDDDAPTGRELYAIYVRESHQGTGLADDLLQAALGDGPALLWVYRDNPRASAFYVHHDFIPDGDERADSDGHPGDPDGPAAVQLAVAECRLRRSAGAEVPTHGTGPSRAGMLRPVSRVTVRTADPALPERDLRLPAGYGRR